MNNINNQITVKPVSNSALEKCQGKTATREVLGCLVKSPQRVLENENRLTVKDFVEPLYKIIFASIFNLARQGAQALDVTGLEEYLKENFPTKYTTYCKYNGGQYLEQAVFLCEPKNYKMNCEEIKKYSLLRDLMSAGIDVSEYHNPDEVDSEISEALMQKFKAATIDQLGAFYQTKILKINNEYSSYVTSLGCKAGGEGAKEQKNKWAEGISYGLSYASNFLTDATDGLQPGRFIVMSSGTNVGKTRIALANIAHTFPIEFWDEKTKSWMTNPNGTQNRVLYIGTEQELRTEIEPVLEAYIANVPQEHIHHPAKYEPGEEERVDKAIDILTHSNIFLEYLPQYNLASLEEVIAKHVFENGVTHVFFDYIHITTELIAEFKQLSEGGLDQTREDQVLANVSNKLKDWARKYNICIYTSTQLNGDFGNDQIRDQRLLRG